MRAWGCYCFVHPGSFSIPSPGEPSAVRHGIRSIHIEHRTCITISHHSSQQKARKPTDRGSIAPVSTARPDSKSVSVTEYWRHDSDSARDFQTQPASPSPAKGKIPAAVENLQTQRARQVAQRPAFSHHEILAKTSGQHRYSQRTQLQRSLLSQIQSTNACDAEDFRRRHQQSEPRYRSRHGRLPPTSTDPLPEDQPWYEKNVEQPSTTDIDPETRSHLPAAGRPRRRLVAHKSRKNCYPTLRCSDRLRFATKSPVHFSRSRKSSHWEDRGFVGALPIRGSTRHSVSRHRHDPGSVPRCDPSPRMDRAVPCPLKTVPHWVGRAVETSSKDHH